MEKNLNDKLTDALNCTLNTKERIGELADGSREVVQPTYEEVSDVNVHLREAEIRMRRSNIISI